MIALERLAADLHDSFHGETEHRFVDCLHADHWRGKAERFARRIPYVAAAYTREARTLDADQLTAAWLEHRRKAPGAACSPENCATYIADEYNRP